MRTAITAETRRVIDDLRLAGDEDGAVSRLLQYDEHLHFAQVFVLTYRGMLIAVFWREEIATKVIDGLVRFGLMKYDRDQFAVKPMPVQGPPPSLETT